MNVTKVREFEKVLNLIPNAKNQGKKMMICENFDWSEPSKKKQSKYVTRRLKENCVKDNEIKDISYFSTKWIKAMKQIL